MSNFTESIQLRSGLTLKNRLVMAPMTIVSSFDNGLVSPEEVQYYADRSSGLAAVITAAANVTANGKGWAGQLKVSDDEAIAGLSEIAQAIQSKGAKAILQIFHAGRMTSKEIIGERPVSASFVKADFPEAEQPRDLTEAEILEIIEAFGQATARAIAAGFDGVEIHGANKYLIQQFFSRHSNIRIDRWGGSFEGRMNFPLAVIDRVLEEARKSSKAFAVGYRFSPVELMTPGIRLDETLEFLKFLQEKPLDYLHVSLRRYSDLSNSKALQEKSMLAYLHEALVGTGIPLIGVGGVRTRMDIENVLNNSEICAIGQQLLVDPEFPIKLQEQRDHEFVKKEFSEAINDLAMPAAMHAYLSKRYK